MYNCHIHTFLEIDVPDGFPNKTIKKMSETGVGYFIIKSMLHNINPFSNKDGLDRLLTFIKEGRKASQEEVFNDCKKYYPEDTWFIALAMDMAYMGAGKPKRSYIDQLYELDRLSKNEKIYPFFHADCRRGNMMGLFNEFVVKRNWTGVKMYPPLGIIPYDNRYTDMYEYCQENNKPIITHCTYGNPVHFKGKKKELEELLGSEYDKKHSRKENCDKFTNPLNWQVILNEFPRLKINFAHSGGMDYMLKWLDKDDRSLANPFNAIKYLCRNYENAYMDISYSLSNKKLIPVLKLLLRDPILKEKVLFGSDYYMSLNECSEKEWGINLATSLSEAEWYQITVLNPRRFLGI